MTAQQPQTINVADLDLAQLRDVRRQLDEELTHLSGSFQQLKLAQAKFRDCLKNVADIAPSNSGRLRDTEHVIVDVGTGYYVRKTRSEATKHYATKVDFVRESIEKLQETLSKKQDNMQYVVNIMHVKEQQAMQTASGSGADS